MGQAFLPSDVVYNNQANTYTTGKQTLAASTNATASMNVPAGAAPSVATAGDLYTVSGVDSHLFFVDHTSVPQELAFLSDITSSSSNLLAANNSWTGSNTFSQTINGNLSGNVTGNLTGNV